MVQSFVWLFLLLQLMKSSSFILLQKLGEKGFFLLNKVSFNLKLT